MIKLTAPRYRIVEPTWINDELLTSGAMLEGWHIPNRAMVGENATGILRAGAWQLRQRMAIWLRLRALRFADWRRPHFLNREIAGKIVTPFPRMFVGPDPDALRRYNGRGRVWYNVMNEQVKSDG